jgi:hypothetical protein
MPRGVDAVSATIDVLPVIGNQVPADGDDLSKSLHALPGKRDAVSPGNHEVSDHPHEMPRVRDRMPGDIDDMPSGSH